MTHDEIIEMWHKAWPDNGAFVHASAKDLEAFARLVASESIENDREWWREFIKTDIETAKKEEREACAKLVESLPPVGEYRQLERATFKDAATAIRARGEAQ